MCGINLIVNWPTDFDTAAGISRMNHALLHRGPDEQGCTIHGQVALGHTRLSIVDIRGGQQPMQSLDARFCISYNGELYNYRELRHDLELDGVQFVTGSDTEVLLQLYIRDGCDCLAKLRGMYAFAIHDREDNSIFVARDRLGIKPLYYSVQGDTLVAASEIKALFASQLVEPRFNLHSLRNYFRFQFAVTPWTAFADVMELPPGHSLSLRPGQSPVLNRYWDLDFPKDGDYESLDEDYWLRRFEDGMQQAVDCHAIGEVPIGSYLSGGVDSSAVAWMLSRSYDQPLHTFSIHFTDPNEDESHIYTEIAEHLKISNQELVMGDDYRGGYLAVLEQCLYHLEQPQRMCVDIPHYLLSGLVQDNKYKVIYTGDGADEILGGYDCYRQDYMRVWGNDIADPDERRNYYLQEYTQWFSEDFVLMLYDLHQPDNQSRVLQEWGTYPAWHDFWHILDELMPELFTTEFESLQADNQQIETLRDNMRPHLEGRHPLNQSLYIETRTRLPGWILWKSDRLSMAHSVEARVPFMDHQLVELAAAVPPGLKLNGMDEKYILRKVAMPHLPEHPFGFKKKAFYTPIKDWIFGNSNQVKQLHPYLSREALNRCGIFRPDTVTDLLDVLTSLPPPQDLQQNYRRVQLEWVLMLVLSIQILHAQFIEKRAPCFL